MLKVFTHWQQSEGDVKVFTHWQQSEGDAKGLHTLATK